MIPKSIPSQSCRISSGSWDNIKIDWKTVKSPFKFAPLYYKINVEFPEDHSEIVSDPS